MGYADIGIFKVFFVFVIIITAISLLFNFRCIVFKAHFINKAGRIKFSNFGLATP